MRYRVWGQDAEEGDGPTLTYVDSDLDRPEGGAISGLRI